MALPGFETTVWPSTRISEESKALLSRFLSLLDLKDPHAGEVMVEEIFTSDARLIASNGTFEGAKELATCRMTAWNSFTFRRHQVERAFVGDSEGREIVMTGKMEGIVKSDPAVTTVTEFAVRIVLEPHAHGKSRLKLWHAFGGNTYPIEQK